MQKFFGKYGTTNLGFMVVMKDSILSNFTVYVYDLLFFFEVFTMIFLVLSPNFINMIIP